MEVHYNNLYTHFVLTIQDRFPCIAEIHRGRIDKVCKYILNQDGHHRKQTFVEEYKHFLNFYQQTLTR